MDLASLQAAADTYRKLGLVQKPLDVSRVIANDLLPGRKGDAG